MAYGRACAIIPAYNEEKGLEEILPLIPTYLPQTIVVDDGSSDNTCEVVEKYRYKGIILLRHETNRGKASALKTGIEKAIEIGYKYLILMDADLQHSLEDIPLFLDSLYNGNDLVIGERNPEEMPKANRFVNKLDKKLVSRIAKIDVKDSQCGFRGLNRRIISEGKLDLIWRGFTIEPEMIIQASLKGYKIDFVKIKTIYYPERRSKIKVLQQGIDYTIMYAKYLPYLLNGRKK